VIEKLTSLMMNLPIVKILRHHHVAQCEAECEKLELLRQQHDLSRRVHVLEWMTFPANSKRPPDDDDR
jgi:hypothetical protein